VQREEIVIPKSVHEARIAQNRDIFAFGLDEDEMHQIADLDAGKRVGRTPTTKPGSSSPRATAAGSNQLVN
jgi:Aldo/keto reductases, related to diketogulonate reductase